MVIERTTARDNLVDVLDRVLDKGVVVDAWIRVSLVGIELVTVEARVVIASIETYLGYAPSLADLTSAPPARFERPPATRQQRRRSIAAT